MQFNVTIERDEDGRYVAECLDLPGCLSEGETLGEALENIGEAILGCLKSRLKLLLEKQPWIEIPAEDKVTVQFDMSGALRYALTWQSQRGFSTQRRRDAKHCPGSFSASLHLCDSALKFLHNEQEFHW